MHWTRPTEGRDDAARVSGFTLMELLVTIVVVGILAALAVPAFNSFVLNDRVIGQINSLVGSFNYARSEAIKQHLSAGVTVCPSSDGKTCNNTTAWGGGWIVLNNDPSLAGPPPSPLAIIQYVPAFGGTNTVTAVNAGATGVTYQYNGTVNNPVTIRICDIRGAAYARDVEVNATGRVAASQKAGQTVNGAALACP
jgi:type IV fimbrial biogenesis protein FimT